MTKTRKIPNKMKTMKINNLQEKANNRDKRLALGKVSPPLANLQPLAKDLNLTRRVPQLHLINIRMLEAQIQALHSLLANWCIIPLLENMNILRKELNRAKKKVNNSPLKPALGNRELRLEKDQKLTNRLVQVHKLVRLEVPQVPLKVPREVPLQEVPLPEVPLEALQVRARERLSDIILISLQPLVPQLLRQHTEKNIKNYNIFTCNQL